MTFNRISIDPQICHGKPCIKGHRIMVGQILDLIADGASFKEVLEEFPDITREDIAACVEYASHLVKNDEVHFVAKPR